MYPLGATDEYFEAPYEEYPITICGQLHQRRVLKGGAGINLTRLEYGALCYLATSPGRVFTKAQIFEAVWSMESESCQSSAANVICNLRKR